MRAVQDCAGQICTGQVSAREIYPRQVLVVKERTGAGRHTYPRHGIGNNGAGTDHGVGVGGWGRQERSRRCDHDGAQCRSTTSAYPRQFPRHRAALITGHLIPNSFLTVAEEPPCGRSRRNRPEIDRARLLHFSAQSV